MVCGLSDGIMVKNAKWSHCGRLGILVFKKETKKKKVRHQPPQSKWVCDLVSERVCDSANVCLCLSVCMCVGVCFVPAVLHASNSWPLAGWGRHTTGSWDLASFSWRLTVVCIHTHTAHRLGTHLSCVSWGRDSDSLDGPRRCFNTSSFRPPHTYRQSNYLVALKIIASNCVRHGLFCG